MKKVFKWALNAFPRPWLIWLSLRLNIILDFFLRGSRYTDPINEKDYRTFLPYGYGKIRQNALSPGTLSLERHRLLWLFLKKETDFFTKPTQVLHIAPEQCFLPIFRKLKHLDYTTADLFSPIADVKADITNLPFEDNVFDVILCNHVLEHIVDDNKAMKELFRVMKPGGWGVFQVPIKQTQENTYEDFSITDPDERKKHFGQYDHVRVYGQDYYKRLADVGFDVQAVAFVEGFSSTEIDRFCISSNEKIPFAKKPSL